MTYQLTTEGDTIRRLENNAWIPTDPANRDYREYLEFLSAGGVPEPAPDPPAPRPDYVSFWEALLASSAYSTVRVASLTDLAANTVTTEFIALLGDAKSGRPYPQALQASIWDLMDAVVFSQAQIDELNGILSATYLDSIYTLTRPQGV